MTSRRIAGRPIAAALLACGIFAIDTLTPPNVEFAALYAIVLLVADDTHQGQRLWLWTAICLVLSCFSFSFLFDPNDAPQNAERFAIACATIVSMTFILVRRSTAEAAVLGLREQIRLEQALERTRGELEHALRAASIGELTGSIAHEVNQPLSAVTTYANATRRWLRRSPPDIAEAQRALDEVIVAAQHASDVVTRVRKLMGKVDHEQVPVPIDPLASDTVRLQAAMASARDVAILLDLQCPGVTVNGDRLLLQQLVLNLIGNAVQALEDVPADKRRIYISTLLDDDLVIIEVEDTGPGFTDEARELAFTSFFTTKARGMGLGLSISRSSAEAHGGTLTIETGKRADGALLRVQLPRSPSFEGAEH